MVKTDGTRLQLSIEALVNSVFITVQKNEVAGTGRLNMGIHLTNRKLPSIHSELVPRSRSKSVAFSYTEQRSSSSFLGFFFLYSEAFESSTASDWLNHIMV